ncbi:prolipoprotein diacylglyceryl transferase [Alkalicella caledoniensis]|uniref:Phosphatidylglycerol--prolipoprotein diacylglyceryl transferase n=1 Tax=Alkalicella caledoniensis TaxID=2731377 RepID=A0A7G9WC78_ALKCA|nr:prolipoprotein diacylglyceryl transferase [Alkalicella caledoniensis]QNO16290.1 prolipoprotein diacylglyceryl transferase [Alkalicella caledoniensis]
MNPVAFNVGPIPIYWYGIIIASGILLGMFFAKKHAKLKGINPEFIDEFVIVVIPLAILGARLYYVIFELDKYMGDPRKIFAIWEGGLAIHGGVLAGIIVAYIFSKVKKISFFEFTDIVAPSLILGQAIGRWGNYVNQEAYGRETDLPWAILVDGKYVHPTFFYESVWNLIVFGALVYLLRRAKLKDGSIMALYLIGYSFGRVFIEGLRTDSLMLGPFRVAQLISGVFILAGGFLLYYLNRKKLQE